MINSYHQKTFTILKSNVLSKSNVKVLQYKQNMERKLWILYRARDIQKMATFDDDLLLEEDLDSIDNENEVAGNVDGSISGNEEMKKLLKNW